MKRIIFVCMLTLGTLLFANANATKPPVDFLTKEIDKISQRIDKVDKASTDLDKKVSDLASQIRHINKTLEDIKKTNKEVTEGLVAIKSMKKELDDIKFDQVRHSEKFPSLTTDIKRLENEFTTSQKIVSWVTAIVSVVVILVSLFFSRRFLELYANYRVIRSRFPKEEREGMGLTES